MNRVEYLKNDPVYQDVLDFLTMLGFQKVEDAELPGAEDRVFDRFIAEKRNRVNWTFKAMMLGINFFSELELANIER